MTNAFLVGAWDGSHLWLQWEPGEKLQAPSPKLQYEVRVAFAPVGSTPIEKRWEEWGPTMTVRQAWFSYPAQRPRETRARAQVRVAGEDDWQDALEATFRRSSCLFEISTSNKPMHYLEGTIFHRQVDGAACAYSLPKELEVAAGAKEVVMMEAVVSSGFSQLDRADDFLLRPAVGVVIRNIAPSQNDLEPTGRAFTEIQAVKRDGPVTMAFLEQREVQ